MATIKTRLEQARDLIKAKQYNEARAILRTLDNPTATQWLAKLDEIAPVIADPFTEMKQDRRQRQITCAVIAVVLLVALIAGGTIYYTQSFIPAVHQMGTNISNTVNATWTWQP